MQDASSNWLIGTTLSHFSILAKIGEGGMGEVYLADDSRLGRKVALKVLPGELAKDAERLKRLQREARSLAALDHPNIVPIYSFEEQDGVHFLTMAFIEGRTLDRSIQSGGMEIGELLDLAVQLADALRAAHQRGIIHRDLKPANVIVDRDGRPRVLDFGLAKQHFGVANDERELTTLGASEQMTQAGAIIGTFPYMSPEQAEGKPVDVRTDLFSFGVMLYEMSCGERPFRGDTAISIISSILRTTHQPVCEVRPELPPGLEEIIAKCLEKDPNRRYPSAEELRADLELLRAGVTHGTITAIPAPSTVDDRRDDEPSRRARPVSRRNIWLGAISVLLVAATIGTWRLWPARDELRTIAVLPFVNTSGDPDNEYLCEGVVETLIDQLSTLPSVRVVPLSAAISAKSREVDAIEAGRQLGATVVLAGELDAGDDRLRVRAELFDVTSASRIWNDAYDRPAGDVLGVQEEIAGAILDAGLRTELRGDRLVDVVRGPTTDGEAYDLFLQARHLQRRATESDYLEAMELLRRATVRDPNFAQAHLALAGIHAAMAIDGYQRPTDAWAQSNRALRRALAIDPELPDAYALRNAMAFFFDWDWEGAARERRRAMQLPAGEFDPDLLRTFSLELLALGHAEEALATARRARELDQLSIGLAMLEADYLVRVGEPDAAIALYDRTIAIEPDNPEQYFGKAEALFQLGRYDEAIDVRRQAHSIAGDDEIAALFADANGDQGYRDADRAWVRAQLVWLEARSTWGYVSPLDLARVHALLGDTEKAYEYLEDAFDDRSPGLVFLNVDRAWDRIRSDPRFVEAVQRVGLPFADTTG